MLAIAERMNAYYPLKWQPGTREMNYRLGTITDFVEDVFSSQHLQRATHNYL